MSKDAPPRDGEAFAECVEFARDARFAIASTHADDGGLASRPLTNQRITEDGIVYLFVALHGDTATQLTRRAAMTLSYADPGSGRYLVLTGEATVAHDPTLAADLWSSIDSAFFPDGPTSPDLGVVTFRTAHAEIWEPEGTRAGQLAKLAARAVGLPAGGSVSRHREIDAPGR